MTAPKTRRVNLSAIPKEKRQEAWEKLQRDYPDQAALLEDPMMVELRKTFNPIAIYIDLPIKDEP